MPFGHERATLPLIGRGFLAAASIKYCTAYTQIDQTGMRGDPLTRTLFGSKSAEIAHGTIWLLYLYSPHAALLHRR